MRLYSGLSNDFIKDAIRNQIAEELSAVFYTSSWSERDQVTFDVQTCRED